MNTLHTQWQTMLESGRIPCMEYPIILNDDKEWLLVDISLSNDGLIFVFDSNGLPVSFDGNIIQLSDNYFKLLFDNYNAGENDSDDLDYYLQAINENILEGFILSNGLYDDSEE